ADTGRWLVRIDGGSGDFAFKDANLRFLSPGPNSGADGESIANLAEDALDQIMEEVDGTRGSVNKAMIYCLDHALEANALARRLSAVARGISTEAAI
ncbi:unnamed protein product, partial [Polarella glacialis]